MEVDLAQFMGAIIENAGGEIRIPYDLLGKMTGDKSISIDLEGDGTELVFRLIDVDDIPEGVLDDSANE